MVAHAYVMAVAGLYESSMGKPSKAEPPPPPNCVNCGAAHEVSRLDCSYCHTPYPFSAVVAANRRHVHGGASGDY